MFTRGYERQPSKLADRHTFKDLVVDSELTSALGLLDAMSPETPAVKIGRCIEYLGQSCSLGCGEDHGGHVSNEDVHPPKTIVSGGVEVLGSEGLSETLVTMAKRQTFSVGVHGERYAPQPVARSAILLLWKVITVSAAIGPARTITKGQYQALVLIRAAPRTMRPAPIARSRTDPGGTISALR